MTLAQRAAAALREAGIDRAVRAVTPIAPIVSPMCRAADWACAEVATDDDRFFVKLREADTAEFITLADAAAGARAAALRGVAPALRFASTEAGAMGFEWLEPPWREARLGDLATPSVLAAVLAAKRALHGGAALARQWDVFAGIRTLAAEPLDGPEDLPDLLRGVGRIDSALQAAGVDSLPCHADGTVSNIMVHPSGAVRLVDFDCAGMTDPHYDMGIVLNEACVSDADWNSGIEMAFGRPSDAALHRCRIYAIADDLFWGLWGLQRHSVSARKDLEFLKYACWRLLRCRMALGRPGHDDQLRRIG